MQHVYNVNCNIVHMLFICLQGLPFHSPVYSMYAGMYVMKDNQIGYSRGLALLPPGIYNTRVV